MRQIHTEHMKTEMKIMTNSLSDPFILKSLPGYGQYASPLPERSRGIGLPLKGKRLRCRASEHLTP